MRVAVIGGFAQSLVNFRGELLKAMVANGHEVLALAPEDDPAVRSTLAKMGVAYACVPLHRAGLNPLRDVAALLSIAGTLKTFGPDTVLTYTVKPVIYGSLAARLASVPNRAALITGVGSALGANSVGHRWLSLLVRVLYWVALRQVRVVFFQKPDDEALFRILRIIGARHRVHRVNGSGVDLIRFSPAPLPPGPVTFLMIGRLLRDKGVFEYVEAARRVRDAHPAVRFQLLGPLDPNPSSVSSAQVEAWCREGVIEYLGSTPDVRPYIAGANVLVLPSYAEGTPRSILEAMAMGRPILTTDAPGCRETVVPGINGLLVPPRSAGQLADALLRLVMESSRIEAMGRASRAIAEQRFDVNTVNESMLSALAMSDTRATIAD